MNENGKYNIEDFYKFSPNPKDKGSESWCVELTKGTFEGLIYRYGKYKLDKDTMKLVFDYEVLYIPEEIMGVDFSDEMKASFDKLLTEILLDLLDKNTRQIGEEAFQYDNKNRENNTNGAYKERFVHEGNNSIFTK
jgi:hypothetical protein